jgi:FKBP-type peptidyl-prolyl cis-trans isomerase
MATQAATDKKLHDIATGGAEGKKRNGIIDVNGTEVIVTTLQAGDATNFPQTGQSVRIHYVARLADGSQFDSSRVRDQAINFRLGGGMVLAGLEAAVRTMSRGQLAKIQIPPDAGYGAGGFPPIVPPNAVLFYEVELISFANVEAGIQVNPLK